MAGVDEWLAAGVDSVGIVAAVSVAEECCWVSRISWLLSLVCSGPLS